MIKKSSKSRVNRIDGNAPCLFWSAMVITLIDDKGYSYSAIAKAINVPMTIVKCLVKQPAIYPQREVFNRLVSFYYEVMRSVVI